MPDVVLVLAFPSAILLAGYARRKIMFCARCGKQIADESEICPLCGRPANLELQPATAAQAAAAPAVAPEEAPAPSFAGINRDLHGVGGWLLFFCVSLVLFSPIFNLTRIVSMTNVDPAGMILEI